MQVVAKVSGREKTDDRSRKHEETTSRLSGNRDFYSGSNRAHVAALHDPRQQDSDADRQSKTDEYRRDMGKYDPRTSA